MFLVYQVLYINDVPVTQINYFKFLGTILTNSGEIEADVKHEIQAGWMKWKTISRVLYNKRIPIKK